MRSGPMLLASPTAHCPVRIARPFVSTARLALLFWSAALLSNAAFGEPGPQQAAPVEPPSVWRASTGIHADDAGLRGSGPAYKVSFDRGGVSFTPALGQRVAHNMPMRFELESVRRGDRLVLATDEPQEPERVGETVQYRHGAGIVERYDVRERGLEQSFTFAAPLPGEGDLVVRLRLWTDLPRPSLEAGPELEFILPGAGGVRVGGVTGIDADGRAVPGERRLDGEHLELVLPADFVDGAAYPLLLDPLIEPIVDVAGGADKDIDPDVAYDATEEVYMVVWQRDFSVSDADIRGQRVLPTGALSGGQLAIEDSDAQEARNPTIASVDVSGRFLVAWQTRTVLGAPYDIVGRSVPASSVGGASAIVTIADEAANENYPDAGGEPTLLDNEALVVWFEEDGGIRGAQVTVPASGSPNAFGHFDLSSNPFDNLPAISKCTDEDGRRLVVWQRLYHDPAPGDHDLRAAVIDRNGNVLQSDTGLGSDVGPDEIHPDVDGDGTRWVVAYEWDPSLGAAEHDIRAVPVEWTGTSLSIGAEASMTSDPLGLETNPAVAYTGPKAFIAWTEGPIAGDTDLVVRGVDPKNCLVCEETTTVSDSALREGRPAIASELSGSVSAGDGALLAWQLFDGAADDGDIQAQLLEAIGSGGTVTNLGGGCGNGGTLAFSGVAAPGNPDFVGLLSGADPGAVIALLLVRFPGPGSTTVCGPCTYLEWPWAYLITTVSSGEAKLGLPIPCRANLAGATLLAQFISWPSGATPCAPFPGWSLTDILSVTFEH